MLAMSIPWPGAIAAEQPSREAAPPAETGGPRPDTALPASHLSRLFGDFEALERLRREIRAHVGDAQAGLAWQAGGMEEFAETIKHSLDRLSDTQLGQASLVELFELDRRVGFHKTDLEQLSERLTAAASQLEDDDDRLETELQRWTAARLAAQRRAAPAEISRRIDDALQSLHGLKDQLVPVRDELLRRLNLVSASGLRIDALRAEIAARRLAVGQQVRTAAGLPLWQATMTRADLVRAKALAAAQFSTRRTEVDVYWREQWALLTVLLLGLFLFSRAALTSTPNLGDQHYTSLRPRELDPLLVRGVLNQPNLSSLALSLMGLAILAPKGPAAFYLSIDFALSLTVLSLWYNWPGMSARVSLVGFTLALLPVLFRGVLELLPLVDRWVMLFQVIVLGSSLTWDYHRGNWQRGFPEFPEGLLRVTVYLTLLSLLAGLAANTMGYVGFARMAIWVTIVLISDLAVFGTFGLVVYVIGMVLASRPWAQHSQLLSRHRKPLLGWLRRALVAGLGLWVTARLLANYGLFDPLVTWAESAMQWQVPLGDGSVSVAQGLTACAILLSTWLLTRCLQLAFEEEVFPRLRMPLRLPFAVSAFLRYLMGFVGVLLAMSALGIDLTKVTLLAGALGVGIGFGLQNIFNNFASGLILLVERPINVGDVIELGHLVGTVRRIGIRSSTVRTLQGAEVILPNAELIAQPVINWTLSDRLRRMEIDLSVKATGETVETVITLLETAARESPDVLFEPPPYALFSGFGHDSLNFRLCEWINRYEDESRIASTVRRAILACFDEVGIRIPDPRGGIGLPSSAISRPEPFEPAPQTS
jgi:small-conductance mechanosensitive channel